MTLEQQVLAAAVDWTRLGQIAQRVGLSLDATRKVIRELLAAGQLQEMGTSPVMLSPRKAYRRAPPRTEDKPLVGHDEYSQH